MSLPGRILLGAVITMTVLIASCGGDHSNTSLSGDQRTALATEVSKTTFTNLTTTFGSGVEVSAALARPAMVQPTCNPGSGGSQNCTVPSTTLDCSFAGTFAISGSFNQTMNTTTNINTVNLTNMTMNQTQCTADNVVLIAGNPKLTLTATGIQVDQSTTPSDIRLPFTVTQKGRVRFTKGPANTDTSFPSSGSCDVNLIATFQQVPGTPATPVQVEAVLNESICDRSINTTVAIGTF